MPAILPTFSQATAADRGKVSKIIEGIQKQEAAELRVARLRLGRGTTRYRVVEERVKEATQRRIAERLTGKVPFETFRDTRDKLLKGRFFIHRTNEVVIRPYTPNPLDRGITFIGDRIQGVGSWVKNKALVPLCNKFRENPGETAIAAGLLSIAGPIVGIPPGAGKAAIAVMASICAVVGTQDIAETQESSTTPTTPAVESITYPPGSIAAFDPSTQEYRIAKPLGDIYQEVGSTRAKPNLEIVSLATFEEKLSPRPFYKKPIFWVFGSLVVVGSSYLLYRRLR